jgi:predicted phage terminase large subunit-like protein
MPGNKYHADKAKAAKAATAAPKPEPQMVLRVRAEDVGLPASWAGRTLNQDDIKALRAQLDREVDLMAAAAAEKSFKEFVKQAWPIVEPAVPLIPGWHLDAICEHLQAVNERQIQRIVINVPPGSSKSLLTCVLFPAWEWLRDPTLRYLCCSYAEDLAIRDARRARNLIESEWYQRRWSKKFSMSGSKNSAERYENDKSGYRISFNVRSGLGERGDRMICDDPHNTKQASSDIEREAAVSSWRETMSMRANTLERAAWIIIMQRLNERDLAGQMLEMGYEHLCLRMRYDSRKSALIKPTSINFTDPRTEDGELLHPTRWSEETVQNMEKMLGPYSASGQLQQDPSPSGGGIFKEHCWRYWQFKGQNLEPPLVKQPDGNYAAATLVSIELDELEEQAQTWDCTFKDTKTSDFVAGQVWGKKRADRFLLDQRLARLDCPATILAVQDMSKRWPKTYLKLVEDKANGPAVIASLKKDVSGLVAVNPCGGKTARANAVAPQIESGNVYLPHPQNSPWVKGFIENCNVFPNGAHDDDVDAMTQMLNRWLGRTFGLLEAREQQKQTATELQQKLTVIPDGTKIATASKLGIATGDNTAGCPECSATCIIRIGGRWRCNQCGHGWDEDKLTGHQGGGRGPQVVRKIA